MRGILYQKFGYQVQNKENIFTNKDFSELASQFCEALKYALETFWEKETNIILQAANDFREIRKERLIYNLDFFSSQIKVEGHKPIITRLSKEFVENILEEVLEARLYTFKFNELTPLEVRILNSFCEFLYKKIKDI